MQCGNKTYLGSRICIPIGIRGIATELVYVWEHVQRVEESNLELGAGPEYGNVTQRDDGEDICKAIWGRVALAGTEREDERGADEVLLPTRQKHSLEERLCNEAREETRFRGECCAGRR